MGVIFITGAPGTGKSTVAAMLHERLCCPWFEFGWIPEFRQLNPHTEISYEEEERMSFENLMLVTENYLRHGFENVILTDIREDFTDEVREKFAGRLRVVILYSASDEVLRERVLTRDNGNEYRDADAAAEINQRFREREGKPDELRVRCDDKSAEEVAAAVLAEMGSLRLVEPCVEYVEEIWAFRWEILETDAGDENRFAGCMSLEESGSAEEWIRLCELRKCGETCRETGTSVPSHTYLAVRTGDERVVGVIDLRHHIDHPILGTWGGHCGYSVRPSERGKGYAKEMLRLNLRNAKALGIAALLVTCDSGNPASERTILANGGVYESTVDADGTPIRRFWINVK